MPTVFAASTINVPAGTVSLWPSIVRLTSGIGPHFPALGGRCPGPRSGPGRMGLAGVALVPERVVLVLAVEVPEGGVDDPARGVAKAAQAAAVLKRVGDSAEVVELDLRPLVGQ